MFFVGRPPHCHVSSQLLWEFSGYFVCGVTFRFLDCREFPNVLSHESCQKDSVGFLTFVCGYCVFAFVSSYPSGWACVFF